MTTTPSHDPVMRELSEYLRDGLNAIAASSSYFTDNNVAPPVAGIRDWNADIKTINEYPLLMVHRVNGNEETHQGRIDYLFGPYINLPAQPGILNWVRLNITRLLRDFNQNRPHGCIALTDSPISYQIFPKQNERQIFSIVRMQFEFMEMIDEI